MLTTPAHASRQANSISASPQVQAYQARAYKPIRQGLYQLSVWLNNQSNNLVKHTPLQARQQLQPISKHSANPVQDLLAPAGPGSLDCIAAKLVLPGDASVRQPQHRCALAWLLQRNHHLHEQSKHSLLGQYKL